ncbi:MAG: DUF5683 domain-containing protein [Bacteroidota bacterium]
MLGAARWAGQLLLLVLLGLAGLCGTPARAQNAEATPDTTQALQEAERQAWLDAHTPRGALRRAAIVPGWGQLYNRQYYKLPIVYLAVGGIIATAIILNSEYQLHRCAFRFIAWEEVFAARGLEANPFPECQTDYQRLLDRFGRTELSSTTIESLRNNLRRNRDLSLIGIGLVYGLTLIDAYISAHLLDFDVSEDLAVSVRPAWGGATAALRYSF